MARKPHAAGPAIPARTMERIETALHDIASATIGEYFFDPDREESYKGLLSASRTSGEAAFPLTQEIVYLEEADVLIDVTALRTWTCFRVTVHGADIAASIEGSWNFGAEELRQPKVSIEAGKPGRVARVLEEVAQNFQADDLEELESIIEDLDHAASAASEPKPLSEPDRRKLESIVAAYARNPNKGLSEKHELWLMEHPGALNVLADAYIAMARADPDDVELRAWLKILAVHAHIIQIAADADIGWAQSMIADLQARLTELADDGALRSDVFGALLMGLKTAGVSLEPSDRATMELVVEGLAEELPDDLAETLRAMFDELADIAADPFGVVEALDHSPMTMSGDLRSFAATEMGLSPHATLREVLPLMLLDGDSAVRRHVAHTLEQIAIPDRLSPVMLRRMIGVRNWVPVADRPAIDSAIRKARLNGVEPAHMQEPPGKLECQMSLVDGVGTVSVFLFDRASPRGLFAGVAPRLGAGFVDMWVETDVARRDVVRMVKETGKALPLESVSLDLARRVIEHALATGLEVGTVPPAALLQIAEVTGNAWHDRLIDVEAEADAQAAALPEADRTGAARLRLLDRAEELMNAEPLFQSWYEDDPDMLKDLRRRPRKQALAFLLHDYLPARRMAWAERFLMTGLLFREAVDPARRPAAAPFLLTAQALTTDGPLDDIPAMVAIARQTILGAREA